MFIFLMNVKLELTINAKLATIIVVAVKIQTSLRTHNSDSNEQTECTIPDSFCNLVSFSS